VARFGSVGLLVKRCVLSRIGTAAVFRRQASWLSADRLDEFSGEATFVAQVRNKIPEGRKYQAAKLVRKTPMMSSADETFMLKMVPILQNLPDVEEQSIVVSDADVILRKPAVVMRGGVEKPHT
jgi:hypothetical protein